MHQIVTRAQAYRARAAECAIVAANSTDSKTRATYAELAAQWRHTANQTEAKERKQLAEG
jgi:hypothetical protein